MVDYNPRYEYKEEKGVSGLLFLYPILMVGADLFLFIFSIAAAQIYFKDMPVLKSASLFIGLAYIIFIVFDLITLYKIPKLAVKVTKAYLFARLAYLVPISIITYITSLNDPNASQEAQAVIHTTIYVLAVELIYALGFSILWYIYFTRAKRIKEYYTDVK